MQATELTPILQAAVGPVILISGVGLLLLSMTNRFGRVADRSRQLGEALRNAPLAERERPRIARRRLSAVSKRRMVRRALYSGSRRKIFRKLKEL